FLAWAGLGPLHDQAPVEPVQPIILGIRKSGDGFDSRIVVVVIPRRDVMIVWRREAFCTDPRPQESTAAIWAEKWALQPVGVALPERTPPQGLDQDPGTPATCPDLIHPHQGGGLAARLARGERLGIDDAAPTPPVRHGRSRSPRPPLGPGLGPRRS